MSQAPDFDLCVIGAGSAGLSIAAGASQLGARVALVEQGAMGGDCLNHGCVPSKALLAAAAQAVSWRAAAGFGLEQAPPRVDFAAVMAGVRGTIAAIAPNDSVARFEGLGVTVIAAAARFLGPDSLQAGQRRLRARRFVIATGARALVPPLPGLEAVPYLTNETLWDLAELPRHLVILGGGPIGCELAQAFARLGSRVTLVEMGRLLPKDDPEATDFVRRALLAEGVTLLEGAKAIGVEPGPAVLVEQAGQRRRVEGSHLLLALGRRVDHAALNLEAAGIRTDKGRLVLDHRLRTSNRRVYAAGDAAGGPQFTHLAAAHAGVILKRVLLRLPARADRLTLPWVTYGDPELAQVGLTEEQAAAQGPVRVYRWPFHDNDRAQTEQATAGLVKLVADRRGRLLGATLVGRHAGELLGPWILAVAGKVSLATLAGMVLPYPTRAEAGKRAAGSAFTGRLFSPRVRRLVRLLLKLP